MTQCVAGLLIVLAGCASAEMSAKVDTVCAVRTPTAVVGKTGKFIYVVGEDCAAGDGSVQRPFNQISDALALAKSGDAVVLGPAQYDGGFVLPEGVHLVAALNGTVVIRGGAGVVVDGKGVTTIRGVVVDAAVDAGIEATGGSLRLEKVVVRKTTSSGKLGHGVVASELARLTLISTQLLDNKGLGLLARKTSKVQIIEPIYLPSPRNAAGKFGIIEPIYQPQSQISGNGLGGVAIIEPIYSPVGSPNVLVDSTHIANNGGFGVGLWGASARISNSAIVHTKVGPGGPWADGVMLVGGLSGGKSVGVQIDARSVIANNRRTGVSMLTRASLQVGADISRNRLCGIWAGAASLVTVTGDAGLGGNTLVGVAVAEGADLFLDGATVSGTVAQSLGSRGANTDAGDGIGVFDGARATIRNAQLKNNARAAVLVHQPKKKADGSPDVEITGSLMTGSKYAVVVNGSPAPSYAASNQYQAADDTDTNGSGEQGSGSSGGRNAGNPPESPEDKTNASMPVKTKICEDGGECKPDF
ncbi:MAG: hypothetical protein KC502_05585 [Myxococcales bacterium]|nr:hypothetical protein [Myxococcales bacterium]